MRKYRILMLGAIAFIAGILLGNYLWNNEPSSTQTMLPWNALSSTSIPYSTSFGIFLPQEGVWASVSKTVDSDNFTKVYIEYPIAEPLDANIKIRQ